MKKHIVKITQLWVLASLSLLVSQTSNASLLTLDFAASDYFEDETTSYYDGTESSGEATSYFPILPVYFQVVIDIDFTQPPKEQSFVTTDDYENDLVIVEYEGKRYSSERSVYDVSFSTELSPFTNELMALMPPRSPSNPAGSYSLDGLFFFNRVVTDLSTGEILQDESSQWFYFNYGFSYRNEIHGPDYGYEFLFGIEVPTLFESIDPVSLSAQQLQEILLTRTDLSLRFNEIYSERVYGDGFSVESALGYVGNGTLSFSVPEPGTLLILSAGLLFLRKYSKFH